MALPILELVDLHEPPFRIPPGTRSRGEALGGVHHWIVIDQEVKLLLQVIRVVVVSPGHAHKVPGQRIGDLHSIFRVGDTEKRRPLKGVLLCVPLRRKERVLASLHCRHVLLAVLVGGKAQNLKHIIEAWVGNKRIRVDAKLVVLGGQVVGCHLLHETRRKGAEEHAAARSRCELEQRCIVVSLEASENRSVLADCHHHCLEAQAGAKNREEGARIVGLYCQLKELRRDVIVPEARFQLCSTAWQEDAIHLPEPATANCELRQPHTIPMPTQRHIKGGVAPCVGCCCLAAIVPLDAIQR
mmetsp:Transcript_24815/g.69153  ORF Transcript_24815/g.69153 Transcript_24815/m.69153 type:complete len:299 (+) Transcript_24815:229-1125(+)